MRKLISDVALVDQYPNDLVKPCISIVHPKHAGNVILIIREGIREDFPYARDSSFIGENSLVSRRVHLKKGDTSNRWCPGEIQYLFRLKKKITFGKLS